MDSQAETERPSIDRGDMERLRRARQIIADIDDKEIPSSVNSWIEDAIDAIDEIDEVYGDE